MQITLKAAVLAALAVGGAVAAAGAQAGTISIVSPTLGTSSQLVFWVSDVSNNTTYADVLSQTVGSVFTPPGNGAAGVVNTYTGTANFNVGVGADSSLVNFINAANTAGQTLTYGITAGASTNSGAGTNTIIATGTGFGADSESYGIAKASLPSAIGVGWATDVASLSTQTTDGSGLNATLKGIIGTPQSVSPSTIQYYGYYPAQAGLLLNQSATLYAITNQQGSTYPNGVSFSLGTVSLTGSGSTLALSFTGNGSPPPVPLPAAFWLLGSGLLGLAGVARRRAA